jgi:nucleotide-binding universal stress UspA family protein
MQKILVGTDGSEPSLKGVRLASEIASAFKAKLVLTYVIVPMAPTDIYGGIAPEFYAREQETAELMLKQAADLVGGVSSEQIILHGPPAETIAESAEKSGCDLVVVGSRGRGMVARMLLGSVADRLVHICKKPVLVAR